MAEMKVLTPTFSSNLTVPGDVPLDNDSISNMNGTKTGEKDFNIPELVVPMDYVDMRDYLHMLFTLGHGSRRPSGDSDQNLFLQAKGTQGSVSPRHSKRGSSGSITPLCQKLKACDNVFKKSPTYMQRDISIEEELQTKLCQMREVAQAWQSKWTKEHEEKLVLMDNFRYCEMECLSLFDRLTETYGDKITFLENDLLVGLELRDKLEKEKAEEEEKYEAHIQDKNEEIESLEKELQRLQKQLEDMSKDVNKNINSTHSNASLTALQEENNLLQEDVRRKNDVLTNAQNSQCMAEMSSENLKILFDISLERLRPLEQFYQDVMQDKATCSSNEVERAKLRHEKSFQGKHPKDSKPRMKRMNSEQSSDQNDEGDNIHDSAKTEIPMSPSDSPYKPAFYSGSSFSLNSESSIDSFSQCSPEGYGAYSSDNALFGTFPSRSKHFSFPWLKDQDSIDLESEKSSDEETSNLKRGSIASVIFNDKTTIETNNENEPQEKTARNFTLDIAKARTRSYDSENSIQTPNTPLTPLTPVTPQSGKTASTSSLSKNDSMDSNIDSTGPQEDNSKNVRLGSCSSFVALRTRRNGIIDMSEDTGFDFETHKRKASLKKTNRGKIRDIVKESNLFKRLSLGQSEMEDVKLFRKKSKSISQHQ